MDDGRMKQLLRDRANYDQGSNIGSSIGTGVSQRNVYEPPLPLFKSLRIEQVANGWVVQTPEYVGQDWEPSVTYTFSTPKQLVDFISMQVMGPQLDAPVPDVSLDKSGLETENITLELNDPIREVPIADFVVDWIGIDTARLEFFNNLMREYWNGIPLSQLDYEKQTLLRNQLHEYGGR